LAPDRSDKDRRGGIVIQTNSPDGLEAVVFDLDSTLCTYPLSVEAVFAEALRRESIDLDILGNLADAAARYAELWGDVQASLESTDRIRLHIVERLLAERGSDDSQLAVRVSDAYGVVRAESGIVPFDGAVELLRDLSERYTLGLLTNGPSDMQWEKIRSLAIADAFDAIVVAGDVRIYKPDARVFELLLDRLGIAPEATLFVGDNYEMDIVGAHRVGMRTAWVRPNGASPTEDVAPDFEVSTASALREVLL